MNFTLKRFFDEKTVVAPSPQPPAQSRGRGWKQLMVVGGMLLMVCPTVFAEDLTLTTYYPSPRGVYKELHVTDRVGIGTTSPDTSARLHILTDGGLAMQIIEDYVADAAIAPWIMTKRARGTKAAPLPVLDFHRLFSLDIRGQYDTTPGNAAMAAAIEAWSVGNYSPTSTGSKMLFRTTAQGTTGAAERMVIDHNGNVGIGTTGTTAPAEKLHLKSPPGADTRLIVQAGGENVDAHLVLSTGFNGNDYRKTAIVADGISSWSRADLHFVLNADANTNNYVLGTDTKMIIKNNGNVGIGTPSPSAKLHVLDGALLASGTTGGTPVSGAGTRLMWVPAKAALRAGQVSGAMWDDADIGPRSFAVGHDTISSGSSSFAAGDSVLSSGTASVAMGNGARAAADYTVALGQTAEAENIHAVAIGRLARVTGAGSMAVRKVIVEGANTVAIRVGDDGLFPPVVTANDALVILGGNVGIGTPGPAHPLHMGSGAHVTAGGVWTDASSIAYKKDIAPLAFEQALETLNGLNPVTFAYKVDEREKHVGFIAEEVPDLVATLDRKSLSPMDIVAVLTKVVQYQQREIEELKARLKERLEALERSQHAPQASTP